MEERGYYGARVGNDLEIDDEALITARIQIAKGQPVKVRDITVAIPRDKSPDRIPDLPLKTQREAEIDPRERQAWVGYTLG